MYKFCIVAFHLGTTLILYHVLVSSASSHEHMQLCESFRSGTHKVRACPTLKLDLMEGRRSFILSMNSKREKEKPELIKSESVVLGHFLSSPARKAKGRKY